MATLPANVVTVKMQVGKYVYPVKLWRESKNIYFDFPFNRELMAEIKVMQGARYHGYDEVNPRKLWSVTDCRRNLFALSYLMQRNPYAPYEVPLDPTPYPMTRYHHGEKREMTLYKHQPMMTAQIVQRPGCIIAGEMGTAKTLPCIVALEILSFEFAKVHGRLPVIWYCAPRAALRAVRRDFKLWGAKVTPEFMTYEGLTSLAKSWTPGGKAPYIVVYDESSKGKNWTAQRTQAMYQFAEGVRTDWPLDQTTGLCGRVVEMSGSPSPKHPVDWWAQAEIACPGFLKEGDVHKLKNRLAVIVKREGGATGSYPELLAWKDDERKCGKCGQFADAEIHDEVKAAMTGADFHDFVACVNEVSYLGKRLSGLVIVYFKKDCLDLPDKVYREIVCEPAPSTLRAAKMIVKTSPTVITGLTRLRELSDGFNYVDVPDGTKMCPGCNGTGLQLDMQVKIETGVDEQMICGNCKGAKQVPVFRRETQRVACPKDAILEELFDEYEDIGRMVIFAGFEGSIERCVALALKNGWAVIQLNDNKERIFDDKGTAITHTTDYLEIFQDMKEEYPRVAFIAHPGSGGMGITLTKSPVIVYYSNTFNAEERIQSEDRIHRPGMDLALGATIIDIIHLESDRKVLLNLKMKRDLQAMTLGDFGIQVGDRHVSTDEIGLDGITTALLDG